VKRPRSDANDKRFASFRLELCRRAAGTPDRAKASVGSADYVVTVLDQAITFFREEPVITRLEPHIGKRHVGSFRGLQARVKKSPGYNEVERGQRIGDSHKRYYGTNSQ
jgi:hypothetical protein